MREKSDNGKKAKGKSFLAKMVERLDKKMEEKAKSQSCCCGPVDKGDSSCCS